MRSSNCKASMPGGGDSYVKAPLHQKNFQQAARNRVVLRDQNSFLWVEVSVIVRPRCFSGA